MTYLEPAFIITAEQIRGARAMLRLDQRKFAALTHLTVSAVRRMERAPGPVVAAPGIIKAVRCALDDAGIELIGAGSYKGVGGPGLRLKGDPTAATDVIDLEEAGEELETGDKVFPVAS